LDKRYTGVLGAPGTTGTTTLPREIMEVSIKREDLTKGLYLVQGVVERRNTLPILANVMIEPAAEALALTATDMEVGVRVEVAAHVKKKGAVTLNARKLYEIA